MNNMKNLIEHSENEDGYDFTIDDPDIATIIKYTKNSCVAIGACPQVYLYLVHKKYTPEQIRSLANPETSLEEEKAYQKYCDACYLEAKALLGL